MALRQKASPAKNLKNRFRFVVLNDETFEEKFSLSLTRTNLWVVSSVAAVTLIFLTAAAIIYTPLKYYIPGFGDYNDRADLLRLQFKTDSLQNQLNARQLWLENLASIANGNIDTVKTADNTANKIDPAQVKLSPASTEDQQLRKEVEDEANYALSFKAGQNDAAVAEVKQMHLMNPVDGYITEPYNIKKEHYGLDIAAKKDAPVKAVLDGKVISASYTLETGYVIEVQHDNNLISIYKHNSQLLKKVGNAVKAGDVIAIVGSTGELSTGPHLHLELWHEGRSLNPKDYIVF